MHVKFLFVCSGDRVLNPAEPCEGNTGGSGAVPLQGELVLEYRKEERGEKGGSL